MKRKKENQGFALVILLIAIAIIALIFFAKGGALDRYKGSSIKENIEQKEAAEEQLKDININLNEHNKQLQKELRN